MVQQQVVFLLSRDEIRLPSLDFVRRLEERGFQWKQWLVSGYLGVGILFRCALALVRRCKSDPVRGCGGLKVGMHVCVGACLTSRSFCCGFDRCGFVEIASSLWELMIVRKERDGKRRWQVRMEEPSAVVTIDGRKEWYFSARRRM